MMQYTYLQCTYKTVLLFNTHMHILHTLTDPSILQVQKIFRNYHKQRKESGLNSFMLLQKIHEVNFQHGLQRLCNNHLKLSNPIGQRCAFTEQLISINHSSFTAYWLLVACFLFHT